MTSTEPHVAPPSRKKWILPVVILVVIVVVSASLYVIFYGGHTYPATPSAIGDSSVTAGSPYQLTVHTGTVFSSASVNFGDGTTVTVNKTGNQNFSISHTYDITGSALIHYTVTAPNSGVFSSSNSLLPVIVSPSSDYITTSQSIGLITVNYSASSTPKVLNNPVFGTNSMVTFRIGYYNEPQNGSYQIIKQDVSSSFGTNLSVAYQWNSTQGTYVEPTSGSQFNYTFGSSGLNYVKVKTITAVVNSTTGAIDNSTAKSSLSFLDVAIFNNGALTGTTTQTFVNVENYIGTPNTFDGAIAYDGQALEPLFNTLQFLVGYVGNSTSDFYPQLAANLPSIANGEINTNYANYSETTPWGTTYTVHLMPYENYTFKIRSNASWQDGSPVTAHDVMYSMVRTLLFDAGSPGTPGWIQAEYMLPGDYYTSNTFYNITQNMSVNSAQNSITFHFQQQMSPSLVFQILAYASGAFVMDSAWINSHGGNITWNATGFQDYKTFATAANYNKYIQNHIMADGPYQLAYVVPGSAVELVANPSFVSPGPMFPKAKIGTVLLEYVSSANSRALALTSGEGSVVSMPTSQWTLVNKLNAAGKINLYEYPSMDMYFYMFNANVSETSLHHITPAANMPSNFFASIAVRKAFAYSFNYNFYFSDQVGNSIYNTTFEFPYAGMLIKGLPGTQSVSDLNKTTDGVPYYDINIAKQWWSKVDIANYGISLSGGKYMYNGSTLTIPLMIPAGNAVDQAAFSTFADALSQVIPGASFPEYQLTFSELLANAAAGSNGMTLWSWLWGPDFPYPTDYMGAMGNPSNLSFFPSANGFTPYLFQNLGLSSQADNLTYMMTHYDNGAGSTNLTYAIQEFQKQNQMLVNMTMYLYLGQYNFFWIANKNVNGADMVQYQTNPVVAGELSLMYNLVSFNS